MVLFVQLLTTVKVMPDILALHERFVAEPEMLRGVEGASHGHVMQVATAIQDAGRDDAPHAQHVNQIVSSECTEAAVASQGRRNSPHA